MRPHVISTRHPEPEIPEGVVAAQLDKDVRAHLRSLAAENAERVAKHLVAAGMIFDTDPELAYDHAMAAQRRAGRVGVVREAAGLAAHRTGRWAQALAELRTARRISGSDEHLPLMADCERGLGRPERVLALAASPEAASLDQAGKVEMLIVAAGARMDLGQHDAAVLMLQVGALEPKVNPSDLRQPPTWLPRLRYAYAQALDAAGRHDESSAWMRRAAEVDVHGVTDAAGAVPHAQDIEVFEVELLPDPDSEVVGSGPPTDGQVVSPDQGGEGG